MGFFQSIFHKTPKNIEQKSTNTIIENTILPHQNTSSSTTASTLSSQDIARFQQFEDGTHIHHLTCPAQNRIINGLIGMAHKSLRLTSQWTSSYNEKRIASLEEIKKERAALDRCLQRTTDERSLSEKWGTCQETIGKGTSGVVRIAHKIIEGKEQLYAVKVILFLV